MPLTGALTLAEPSDGRTIAFQPEGSDCSAVSPARSAAVGALPGTPTPLAQPSPPPTEISSVASAAAVRLRVALRTRASEATASSGPPSVARPLSAAMRSEGDATISSCDESSCAGSVTATVSGSSMEYAAAARTVSRTTVSERRSTSAAARLGPTMAFQPRGSSCAERMPASSAARSTSTAACAASVPFVPLVAFDASQPAPPPASASAPVAFAAAAPCSANGTNESPVSEIVSSIWAPGARLPPRSASSERERSNEPESAAWPADGRMRMVLFES